MLAALSFSASQAHGQRAETGVDIGAVALRYADTLNASAVALSPHATLDWGSTLADASGTFSQFMSGGWSAQGALSASRFSSVGHSMIAELGAFAGGSTHHDGTRTGEVLANLRLHYIRESGEFFLGGAVGRTNFGGGAEAVVAGDVGFFTRMRGIEATVTVSPVALDSTKYADSQLSLSWTRSNVDFDALVGFRAGDQLVGLGATSRGWGSVSAVFWLKPHLAAVLGGGSYPIDPTQGFPGGRFVSASVRLARGNRHRVDSTVANTQQPVTQPVTPGVIEEFAWERSGARDVTLRARVAGARSVEVSGDFTNWTPVRLAPAADSGWWSLTLPLRPGKYQMNLRVDGGKWLVPPGVLSMVDEFGGAVGLLVVE